MTRMIEVVYTIKVLIAPSEDTAGRFAMDDAAQRAMDAVLDDPEAYADNDTVTIAARWVDE